MVIWRSGRCILAAGLIVGGCARLPVEVRGNARQTEIVFQSGARLSYAYENLFNRNALKAVMPAGDGWVALTQNGVLMRFDSNFRLEREESESRYTCICLGGDGEILAARGDGGIEKVDGHSLAAIEIEHVPGSAVDMAWDKAGKRVMAILTAPGTEDASMAWDPVENRGYALAQTPSVFHVDSRRQLWIGADHGEWGGYLRCLDLATGKTRDVEVKIANIYGMTELRDGTMLFYGGYSHFGANGAGIAEAKNGTITDVYQRDHDRNPRSTTGPSAEPEVPVTNIVEMKDGTLAVFSYDDVYVTDRDFKKWRLLTTLDLEYVAGRPDAMSAYPAVKNVWANSGRLVGATALDGLLEVKEGKAIKHALPGQVNLEHFELFGRTWKVERGEGRWRIALEEAVPSGVLPFEVFKTPDERTWAASGAGLEQFVDGKWRHESGGPEHYGVSSKVINDHAPWMTVSGGHLWELKEDIGKPALLVMKDTKENALECRDGLEMEVHGERCVVVATDKGLYRWEPGGRVQAPEIRIVGGNVRNEPTSKPGAPDVTLAKEGLCPVFSEVESAQCMCRDEKGVVWIGGKGLWFLTKEAERPVGVIAFSSRTGLEISSMIARPGGGILAVTSEGELLRADVK